LLGILKEKNIWATDILYLNDSQELLYAFELMKKEVSDQINSVTGESRSFLEEYQTKLEESIKGEEMTSLSVNPLSSYVCSFCSYPDLLSQWRAYSGDGTGYSIGFDFCSRWDEWNDSLFKEGFAFIECIYKEEKQTKFIQEILEYRLKEFQRYRESLIKQHFGRASDIPFLGAVNSKFDFFRFASRLNHPKFFEEKEWRLVSLGDDGDLTKTHFGAGTSTIKPFRKIKLAEESKRLPLSEIWIGPTTQKSLSYRATRQLLDANGYQSCELKYSEIPYRGHTV